MDRLDQVLIKKLPERALKGKGKSGIIRFKSRKTVKKL